MGEINVLKVFKWKLLSREKIKVLFIGNSIISLLVLKAVNNIVAFKAYGDIKKITPIIFILIFNFYVIYLNIKESKRLK